MKILFIVPYPTEGASNRIRVEAFLPFLDRAGIRYKVRPFVSDSFYKILYKKGYSILKMTHFLICAINRMLDLIRVLFYDVVFIHREAFPFGPPLFEKMVHMMGKPIIFDFDDAIYLPADGPNTIIGRFKNPGKIKDIIKMSRVVITGNDYLAEYAKRFNNRVEVIPSSVDTDYYSAGSVEKKQKLVIGWIGSGTTEKFLNPLRGVFTDLNRKYGDLIEYHLVGARFDAGNIANIRNIEWELKKEKEFLAGFDIGIMPMPDDEWTKGKCGYKALLCMSMKIPVIASPVGVNSRIIKDGKSGFLAVTHDDWVEKISRLIEDADMRRRFGMEGRKEVESAYATKTNSGKFVRILKEAYACKKMG